MTDSLPVWFAIPAIITAWVLWIVLEFRASRRFYAAVDASNPVVVSGSGHRSNRHPRACGGAR